jgi:hypothetical protein
MLYYPRLQSETLVSIAGADEGADEGLVFVSTKSEKTVLSKTKN